MANLSLNLGKRVGLHLVESVRRLRTCPMFSGLKLGTLEADTVQLSKTVDRWSGPAENYIPAVYEGSWVSSHHELNMKNTNVRCIIRDAKNGIVDLEQYSVRDYQRILKTDKEFAKLPPLEKDCIVYRGRKACRFESKTRDVDFEIIENAKVGEIIVPDLGYSYTGLNSGACDIHGGNRCFPKAYKTMAYEIRLPKGAKVSRNLEHEVAHGGEAVMPRGAEYRLISKETNGNHTDVVLEYILPTKDNVAEIEGIMRKYNIPLTQPPKVKPTKQIKPMVNSNKEVPSFMSDWTSPFDK